MAAFLSINSRNWIASVSLLTSLLTQASLSQTSGKGREGPPKIGNTEESSRFIAAFKLNEENGFSFTWPFESMPPSSYETIVMVVEKMPRIRNGKNGSVDSEELLASRRLRINGRHQKPYRVLRVWDGDNASQKQFFLVKLENGRLRLSLPIPEGMIVDVGHEAAKIVLYKAI